MTAAPPIMDLPIRLADEGVPLRAIARATGMPSAELRNRLQRARADGRLLELPREDWPPGFPRDQRALQLARMYAQNRRALHLNVQKGFRLTPTQATLLLALLQYPHVSKAHLPMSGRCADVHMWALRRRLDPLGLRIETIWGHGFQLAPGCRRRAMDMVLSGIAANTRVRSGAA